MSETFKVTYMVNGARVYPDGSPAPEPAPAAPTAPEPVEESETTQSDADRLLSLKRDQLVIAAKAKGIDVPASATKTEIVDLILSADTEA